MKGEETKGYGLCGGYVNGHRGGSLCGLRAQWPCDHILHRARGGVNPRVLRSTVKMEKETLFFALPSCVRLCFLRSA